MFTLGPLAFLNPLLLAPLAGLPLLWWLLRLTPPAPRRVSFPAIRLLMGITQHEETPRHTPWWLLLLRCLIISCILVGLARPILNPATQMATQGPLLLVIDDGWAAGPSWVQHQSRAASLLDEAERNQRPVRLVFTTPHADGSAISLSDPMPAADARQQLATHLPSPWPIDRAASLRALSGSTPTDVVYFSDGTDGADAATTTSFLGALQELGAVQLYLPAGGRLPLILLPPDNSEAGLELTVRRAPPLIETHATLRALAADGRLLTRDEILLPANAAEIKHTLRLPADMRNAITRLELEGEPSASAVVLLDAHWRRRPVGIVAGSGADKPLVGEAFYLERALKPYADIRSADLATLLTQGVSLLVLADIAGLAPSDQTKLTEWIKNGGVLLRFGGPNMASKPDELLPVKLRSGERDLNGAMSWSEPLALRSFSPTSPFVGLNVPADIRINRQLLAEPAPDLAGKSWATLADGTPLITGQSLGKGWLVLIHTTANADWSNLPLSGLYVDMLRRLLELSAGVSAGTASGPLLPIEVLGGLGQSLNPPPTAQPIAAEAMSQTGIGPIHPPGFYGSAGMRLALNFSASITHIAPMPAPPLGISIADDHGQSRETPLLPWLIGSALLLLALDMLIVLRLRGLLAPALAMLLLLIAAPAHAEPEDVALLHAQNVWLAYVSTGDTQTDSQSDSGLKGLRKILLARTSIEPGGVTGIDLEQDELSLYPLLYWPVTSSQPVPSEAARAKLNSYLQHGGMILFDTQDGQDSVGGNDDLIRLTAGLDLPALAPIKADHTITRSFYLLKDFPGTYRVNTLWADANPERRNDNVSDILIGGGNWAAAWAAGNGNAWESSQATQPELARRFGVNLMVYALTGNYKSDQIHIKTILERLGK